MPVAVRRWELARAVLMCGEVSLGLSGVNKHKGMSLEINIIIIIIHRDIIPKIHARGGLTPGGSEIPR